MHFSCCFYKSVMHSDGLRLVERATDGTARGMMPKLLMVLVFAAIFPV